LSLPLKVRIWQLATRHCPFVKRQKRIKTALHFKGGNQLKEAINLFLFRRKHLKHQVSPKKPYYLPHRSDTMSSWMPSWLASNQQFCCCSPLCYLLRWLKQKTHTKLVNSILRPNYRVHLPKPLEPQVWAHQRLAYWNLYIVKAQPASIRVGTKTNYSHNNPDL
jgi:hypothetical protein